MMSLTHEQLLNLIQKKIEQIPDYSIYYALRDYGVKRIKPPTRNLTKECLALHYLGLPIIVPLLELIHTPKSNIYNLLHRLGDNKVLVLVKSKNMRLRYIMSPMFINILKLPEELDEVRDRRKNPRNM